MIIHVGSNNVPSDTPQVVAQKLMEMVQRVKTIMPTTKLYYSNILSKLNEQYTNGINYINAEIGKFCDQQKIKQIQRVQFCPDYINFRLLRRGVIHPSFKGASTPAKNMIASYRNYDLQPQSH